jgi:hypothetical protein
VRDEHVSPKAEATAKRGFWTAVKAGVHNIFVEVASVVIETGIKWIIKAIPTLIKAVL